MNAGGGRRHPIDRSASGPAGDHGAAAATGEAAGGGTPVPPIIDRIQKVVEEFRRTAPAVTQVLMMTTAASWLINLLILPRYTFECIPYFIVQEKFELYRLITSLLVNRDLFPTLWACLLLAQHGRTVEESIGSAATIWLAVGVFTMLVNILYCFVQVMVVTSSSSSFSSTIGTDLQQQQQPQQYIDQEPSTSIMYWEAPGIWSALLGLVTVEACRVAQFQPHRSFCNRFKVPTKLYPLCLLLVRVLWMNNNIGPSSMITLCIAIGLGYYIGLHRTPPDNTSSGGLLTAPTYLVGYLDTHFRGSPGWIGTTASIGPAAWMHAREPLFSGLPSMQEQLGTQPRTELPAGTTNSSTGQALGGAGHQRNVDARTARLQALEQRQHVV